MESKGYGLVKLPYHIPMERSRPLTQVLDIKMEKTGKFTFSETENEIKVRFVIGTDLMNDAIQCADLIRGCPFTVLV